MAPIRLAIPTDMIAPCCRRWPIRELALFGSVLHAVDVRLVCDNGAAGAGEWAGPLRHSSLAAIEQSANATRRETILSTAQVVYRAE